MTDSATFGHPTREPRSFDIVRLDVAPVHHVTVLVRNQRIRKVGGTADQPVLQREFVVDDEWQEVTMSLSRALHDLGEVQMRFIGEGFDPWGTSPGDQDAIDNGLSAVVIATFEDNRLDEIAAALAAFLDEADIDNCWFLPTLHGDEPTVLYRQGR